MSGRRAWSLSRKGRLSEAWPTTHCRRALFSFTSSGCRKAAISLYLQVSH